MRGIKLSGGEAADSSDLAKDQLLSGKKQQIQPAHRNGKWTRLFRTICSFSREGLGAGSGLGKRLFSASSWSEILLQKNGRAKNRVITRRHVLNQRKRL